MFKFFSVIWKFLFNRKKSSEMVPRKVFVCPDCNEQIQKGDFVCEGYIGNEMYYFHAGFHKSLVTGEDIFCETAALGIGYWDGEKVGTRVVSGMEHVLSTGKPFIGEY